VNRGDVFRAREPAPERGNKPGYYVVVSRQFIACSDHVATVVCAPVYSQVLGLATELVVGPDEGLPRTSAVRCDFLMLTEKARLTRRVGRLSGAQLDRLNRALAVALDLPESRSAR